MVSFVLELNSVATAGWSVTVSGMSFGSLDVTPSNRVSLTSCMTASWASASSVVCLLAAGDGPQKDLQVTAVGIAGTRTKIFTYDGSYIKKACQSFWQCWSQLPCFSCFLFDFTQHSYILVHISLFFQHLP